jgi:hypothetical protein
MVHLALCWAGPKNLKCFGVFLINSPGQAPEVLVSLRDEGIWDLGFWTRCHHLAERAPDVLLKTLNVNLLGSARVTDRN